MTYFSRNQAKCGLRLTSVFGMGSRANQFVQHSRELESEFRQLVEHPKMGLVALANSGVYQFLSGEVCQKLVFNSLSEAAQIERLMVDIDDLFFAVRSKGLMTCSDQCSKPESFAPAVSHTRVREIVAFGEYVFVGTHRHGFFQLTRSGEVLRNWHRQATREEQSLPANGVMTLMLDDKYIWAGLWAGGLHQFDLRSGNKITASQHYEPDTSTLGGRHVRAMLRSSNGTRYIGHENGVSVLIPDFNQQGWIGLANDNQVGFSQTNMRTVLHTEDGWLAQVQVASIRSVTEIIH